MRLFADIVFFAFLAMKPLKAQDPSLELDGYKKIHANQFIDQVISDTGSGPGILKTKLIAEFILKERRYDLFKMGLDDPRLRHEFYTIANESDESHVKDEMLMHMLKNSSFFLDFGSGSGSFPASESQAKPYLYLFDKYLPGTSIDPRDFDYSARRKPLVDKLEAAMAEKRKPRELRRPDASDFEERSADHNGRADASGSSSVDGPNSLKPVSIGIAASVAVFLALLGFMKLKKSL